MKNKEYYEDDIFTIINKEIDNIRRNAKKIVEIVTSKKIDTFGVAENTSKIIECSDSNCDICLFKNEELSCSFIRNEWANSEYTGTFKLTSAEKIILENLDKEFKWVARDSDGVLILFTIKPRKGEKKWRIRCKNFTATELIPFTFTNLFKFIKWEDEEPYLVEDILKNCEVIDDDLG